MTPHALRALSGAISVLSVALLPCTELAAQRGRGARAPAPNFASQQARSIDPAWASQFTWDALGPANMSGRITDLAVYEADPKIYYVATATAGLMKTVNNGVTFEHVFEDQPVCSIGAVAVSATDPDVVWVGTGEENPRNSASYGNGVYKSLDGGKTWEHVGLEHSFQIGSVWIHPQDSRVVLVGALGRLYGPSEERGLYKTTDGGASWTKILHVDDLTGVIDIAVHPTDFDTMLVATYERQRDGFDTNDPAKKLGPGSGLYRTTDGGRTFTEIRTGLPTGTLGRIDIDWYRADPKVVFALVESDKIGMVGDDVGDPGMSVEDAEAGVRITRVTDDGPAAKAGLETGDLILEIGGENVIGQDAFRRRITAQSVGDTLSIERVRDGEVAVVELVLAAPAKDEDEEDDEPSRPYGTRLGGQVANVHHFQGKDGHEFGGLYRSDDAGLSWRRINSINPRPMYFSHVRVDPQDDQKLYVLGISAARSVDGGETFTTDASRGVHSDQHVLWIDPNDGNHLLIGSDGGLYASWDRTATWHHHNHMDLGQFYHVAVGPRRDYWVYGGLQDNGSWGAPRRGTRGSTVNEDWLRVGSGDGFVMAVDAEDPNQIYYESQNGGMGRTHLLTMEGGGIRPPREQGVDTRFNWRTPFALSHFNSKIYYCAGNYVFRSLSKGNDLKRISPEISRTDRGSATAFAESPRDADVLYVGTDDGALWRTVDGGAEWTDLLAWPGEEAIGEEVSIGEAAGEDSSTSDTVAVAEASVEGDVEVVVAAAEIADAATDIKAADNKAEDGAAQTEAVARPLAELIDQPMWVAAIEASHHDANRVYLTLDGHRHDDDHAHIFVSEDRGDTWTSLANGLPRGSSRVLREDHSNPDVLYLGTEFGFYVSIDRGRSWTRLHNNLPTVPVHEVAQHDLSGEIVLATHGRSLWALDATPIRQMTADAMAADAFLFEPNDVVRWRRLHSRGNSGGASIFQGTQPRGDAAIYYRLAKPAREVQLEIRNAAGETFRTLEGETDAGLHRVDWNLAGDSRPPTAAEVEEMVRRWGERARRFAGRSRPQSASEGTWTVALIVDGVEQKKSFELLADPSFRPESLGARLEREMEAAGWLDELNGTGEDRGEDSRR